MSSQATKTDHSYFDYKLRVRLQNLPAKKCFSVLDCFCGAGSLWQSVQARRPDLKINVLSIDKKMDRRRLHLIGDNIKFLASLDLTKFDAIDLDAYGVPYAQLSFCLGQKLRPGTVFYVTLALARKQSLPKQLLYELGYSEAMINKCKTLCSRPALEKFKRFLAGRGVRRISYYAADGRKFYLCFRIE